VQRAGLGLAHIGVTRLVKEKGRGQTKKETITSWEGGGGGLDGTRGIAACDGVECACSPREVTNEQNERRGRAVFRSVAFCHDEQLRISDGLNYRSFVTSVSASKSFLVRLMFDLHGDVTNHDSTRIAR
jgi:hypothetical protein